MLPSLAPRMASGKTETEMARSGVVKGHGRRVAHGRYQTLGFAGEMVRKGSVFACALMFSPVRMADQTACPEGSLARARKGCEGQLGIGGHNAEIWDSQIER